MCGSMIGPSARNVSKTCNAVRPMPHSTPPVDNETRSLSTGHLGQPPAVVQIADEVLGRNPNVGEEDLVEGVATGDLGDLTNLDARKVHRTDQVRDAPVLRQIRIGAGDENAIPRELSATRPRLLAVDDELVTVSFCSGAETCQVASAPWFAEQLAPEILATEQAWEVPQLLHLRPAVQQRRTRPPDTDRIVRPAHPRCGKFLVDDHLMYRIGAEPVRGRPVGCDVAGFGQGHRGRLRVGV